MHSNSHSRQGSGIPLQHGGLFANEQPDYARRPNNSRPESRTGNNNDNSRNHDSLLQPNNQPNNHPNNQHNAQPNNHPNNQLNNQFNNPQQNNTFRSPPQAIGPKSNSKMNCWYLVRSVICIVEWIVNLVANLGLFTIFLIFGEIKFASITLGIFVCGKFVVHVLSATWRCDDLTPDGLDKNCYSGWDLFLGLYPRYQMILDFARQIRNLEFQLKNKRNPSNSPKIEDIETAIKQEEFDLIVLRVIETFLTVAPQLVFQLVIFWQLRGMEVEVAQPDTREYLELSVFMLIVVCVCNVVLTLWMYNSVLKETFKDWLVSLHGKEEIRKKVDPKSPDYDSNCDVQDFMEKNEARIIKENHIHRTARISFVLAFLSSFAFMVSRVVALCAMIFLCSQSGIWIVGGLLIFTCHIFVIFFALSYQGSQFTGFENEQEVVFRLIMSFIYTFYFLPIQRQNLRIKVSLYNLVTGIENLIMIYLLFRIGSSFCDDQASNLQKTCENVLSTESYELSRCPKSSIKTSNSPDFEAYRRHNEDSCESFFGIVALYGVFGPWLIGLVLYIFNYFVLDPRRKFGLDGGRWHCFGKKEERERPADAEFMVETPGYTETVRTFDFNQVQSFNQVQYVQNGQNPQNARNDQNYQNGQNYQTTPQNQNSRLDTRQNKFINQTTNSVVPLPHQYSDDNGPTHVSLNTLQHLYMDKLGLTSPMDINFGKTFNLNTIGEENNHSLTPIGHGGSRQPIRKQVSVISQGNGDFDRPELHTFGRGNRARNACITRAAVVGNTQQRNRLNSKNFGPPKNRIPELPE